MTTRESTNKDFRNFIFFIVFSLILFFLDQTGIGKPLKGAAEQVVVPVKRQVNAVSIGSGKIADIFMHFDSVKDDHEKLLSLSKDVEVQTAELRRLIAENESLRKQLEAPLPASFKFIPAEVLGISRYMLIWGGEKDGIRKGMSVVDGKILIGKVISTTQITSRVILPTDPDSSIGALSSRGTRGTVRGQFGEKVYFQKILQKDSLFLDDLVLTSGEDGYAPGLLIGSVGNIESKDFEVYKRGELKMPIQYNRESTVFVITGT